MKSLLICLVALIGSAVSYNEETEWTEELVEKIFASTSSDDSATVPYLVAKNGYTVNTYSVETEDGYVLEMHRILGSPKSPKADGKPVVFLMHGLLSSSADWIVMGPGKGLGYILADAGYDVWMGNARGNTYSKKHTTITNYSGKDFWYFSWYEIGYYDLPAMIDYALNTSGQTDLIYIGHSQGTTSFYVMASQRTDYNAKIKAMFSLAPVAYMGNLKSPLLRLASTAIYTVSTIINLFGIYEFMPSSDLISTAGELFCNDDALTQRLCSNVLFVLCGFNKAQLNTTMLPTILGHSPAGSSSRQLIHYGQEIRSGKFRQYDHLWISNKLTYGSWTPPAFDVSAITAPVYLIYSDNDWMAAVKDVTQLYSELGNPMDMIRVSDDKWNHLDYLWGIDAPELVYNPIIDIIETKYRN